MIAQLWEYKVPSVLGCAVLSKLVLYNDVIGMSLSEPHQVHTTSALSIYIEIIVFYIHRDNYMYMIP